MLKRIFVFVGIAIILLAVTSMGDTSDRTELKVYWSAAGNDTYNLVGVYPISFEAALKDFAAAGGAPFTGAPGDQVLNIQKSLGVTFEEPQSWDAFVAFLEERYGQTKDAAIWERCDGIVQVDPNSLTYTCAGLSCPPDPDECVGFFASASINYICLNIPRCPVTAPYCRKMRARLPLSSFTTSDNPVCRCGFTNECEKHPSPGTISGFMHQVAACRCYPQGIPSLSQYGLMILILALAGAALLVFRRRRSALAR